MANILTALTDYATRENAEKKLAKELAKAGSSLTDTNIRYLIGVNEAGRFVPVLVGAQFAGFAHAGIMVVG